MLLCLPTLAFRGTAQQNVDHSPLGDGCPTFHLAVCILRPPATFFFKLCMSYKNYTLIYAVMYTTYCCFSKCVPRNSPQ